MTDSDHCRVLFDVSRQAHVHLFKHVITDLERNGHETLVTSRKKGEITRLLDAAGIDHRPISKHRRWGRSLVPEWVVREHRLITVARQFDPAVVVSQFTPCAVHAAHLANARSIVFTDDEAATDAAGMVTHPFASYIYTPQAFRYDLGPKHRRYDGYHELAYLHPDRFEPDPSVLTANGIDPERSFFVLGFEAWEEDDEASVTGFSPLAKRELVEFLSQHGEVYVDADCDLPPDLDVTGLPVPAENIHHLLSYADLYAGDSPTMAVEAGTLGTPAVWSRPGRVRVPGHLQQLDADYSLVLSFDTESETVVTVKNLAVDPKASERWEGRREQMVSEMIDVTGFMSEMIRNQGVEQQHRVHRSSTEDRTYELA